MLAEHLPVGAHVRASGCKVVVLVNAAGFSNQTSGETDPGWLIFKISHHFFLPGDPEVRKIEALHVLNMFSF